MKDRSTGQTTWFTAANGLTVLRFVLAGPLVVVTGNENYLAAICSMAVAGASDIADGKLARRSGTASPLGAILDVTADVTLVLVVQARLVASGEWPAYLLVLSLLSILTFLLIPADPWRVSKHTMGKYVGALLMCAVTVHLICKAISPGRCHTAVQIVKPAVAAYLALAIAENLSRSARFSMRRSHD